jgi:nucleoside-diphosphate-sugar epimerase
VRILVTGHKGYIGSRLTPVLLERGHDVVGLDADWFDGCTFGSAAPVVPSVQRDVRDVTPALVTGFDAVVHLAGLSNDPLGDYDPILTGSLNRDAAVRLARIARDAGVRRFVFASSCSIYGAAGSDWRDERGPISPVGPYGRSKAEAEVAIGELAGSDFSPTFLRVSTA